jgi:hypothetical protein
MTEENELSETYLKIARMLAQKVKGGSAEISSELGVGGRMIRDTRILIDNGYINIDERGRPMWAKSFNEALDFLEEYKWMRKRKMRPLKRQTAEEAVAETVQKAIASDAQTDTEQFLTLGRAIWTAYAQWAAKRGMDITKMREVPIHKAVLSALEKEAKYDELEKRLIEMEDALRVYAEQADPAIRASRALHLINRFVELAMWAEALEGLLGFPILNIEPIAQHYNKILTLYLKGAQ